MTKTRNPKSHIGDSKNVKAEPKPTTRGRNKSTAIAPSNATVEPAAKPGRRKPSPIAPTSSTKAKPAKRTRQQKPSFDAATHERTKSGTTWVYRSDKENSAKAGPANPAQDPNPGTVNGDRQQARQLVDQHRKYATVAGMIPVPVIDFAAITGIQLIMLSKLAEHYNVPFNREREKTLLTAILGGAIPTLAGHQVFTAVTRHLTLAGALVGIVSQSGFASASTHAVGHLFISHFESGGTFLDLDLTKSKQKLAKQLSGAPQSH